jgi:succinate dehydrogenase/fumarate reductase flavoprotein subunit
MNYDLIVVGGGFAGVCAAISASENGVKTLLVDKSNALGGAAHNCLVNPFMPTHTKVNGEKK